MALDRLFVAAGQVRVLAPAPDWCPVAEGSGFDPDRVGRKAQLAVVLVCC